MTECQSCYIYTATESAELSEGEKEQQADELLRETVEEMGRDEEYSFHAPSWLRYLCERDRNVPLAETSPAEYEYTLDWREAAERLLQQTPMAPEYETAFRLRLWGLTYREIGERLRVSLDTARRWTIGAVARLAEAAVGLDQLLTEAEMIREVFYEESNRHGYHPPRHCKPGQEACRKTGKCRRWYLIYEL